MTYVHCYVMFLEYLLSLVDIPSNVLVLQVLTELCLMSLSHVTMSHC